MSSSSSSSEEEDETKRSWLSKTFHRSTTPPIDIFPHERTSLLPKPPSTLDAAETASADEIDDKTYPAKLWFAEFLILLKASIPVILAYALQSSFQTVSVLTVSRLSPEALAIAAFSYMFAMSTAWLIALGGTTALDTLASSSYTGSPNPHDLGILLQRGIFVLTLFYIPVAALWYFSAPVFRLLGQEEYICVESARFLTALIPGGLGFIYLEATKKYLQAQGLPRLGSYVLLLTSPLNAVLNYLLIHRFNLGLLGAPLATGTSYWLSFLLILLCIPFSKARHTWGGFSRASLSNLFPFVRLALAGIIHIGTEWWAFEIVALAAGRLGSLSLAAQSVIMTSDPVINTIPFGIGVAASSRVGNLLGARNARGAARTANAAAWLGVIGGCLLLVVLMATKNVFGRMFSDDPAVIHLVAQILPLVALFQIADGINGACGGSLRGMGRQHVGAVVNLVAYYGGALPGGIWLAFHGWGLQGLWTGQCVALSIVGMLEWVIVARSDWEGEVRRAFRRLEGSVGEAVR